MKMRMPSRVTKFHRRELIVPSRGAQAEKIDTTRSDIKELSCYKLCGCRDGADERAGAKEGGPIANPSFCVDERGWTLSLSGHV